MKRLKLKAQERRGHILEAALQVAQETGWRKMTREDIADAAGVACGLVGQYFGGMEALRSAVMKEAVHRGILPVVAEGLALRHSAALAASPALKRKAANSLS